MSSHQRRASDHDLLGGVPGVAVRALLERERAAFSARHGRSATSAKRAAEHWLNGVPMHWMTDWGTPFPLVVSEARGATLVDADGLRYADFCLGDTGAMFGHSPPAVAAAVRRQSERGLTCMLPSDDVAAVGELLARRFGLPFWQVTQTATDANRAVLRWARAITGRRMVLVFDGCYHGALEDALVCTREGRTVHRAGLVGQVTDVAGSTRVVDFNDADGVDRALAPGDVACVLAEPVMTNAGMVLPEGGFLEHLRERTQQLGTLLAFDETHTLSSGPGGHARGMGLAPDFLVAGKAIAGGVPSAVYGFNADVERAISRVLATKPSGHSGIGTTLAGNPLAIAALRACLTEVMTEAAYGRMLDVSAQLASGLGSSITARGLPWHVSAVGARSEFGFRATPPRTGRESLDASIPELEQAIRLYLLNRGVLITPFHNMMLASPATTAADLNLLLSSFDSCLDELLKD